MAKKKAPVDDVASEILDKMVQDRGERKRMGEHWDAARAALGQARWYAYRGSVSVYIDEMRRELSLGGLTPQSIWTSEKEVENLIREGENNKAKSLQTAKKYLQRLNFAIRNGKVVAIRDGLERFLSHIERVQLPLTDLGVTEAQIRQWRRKYPPRKKKTKS